MHSMPQPMCVIKLCLQVKFELSMDALCSLLIEDNNGL